VDLAEAMEAKANALVVETDMSEDEARQTVERLAELPGGADAIAGEWRHRARSAQSGGRGAAGPGEILADLGKPVDALRDLDRVASSGSVGVIAARGLALAALCRCLQ
jgi:hypothetical protein